MGLKTIIFIFVLFFFPFRVIFAQNQTLLSMTPVPTPSIEYSLPYPGVLPDHPLYLFKIWRDKILLLFSQDQIKKSQLELLFADKHLVMGQILWEKKQYELATKTFLQGERYLLSSVMILGKYKKQSNLPPNTTDKFELATRKHQEILEQTNKFAINQTYREDLENILNINNQALQQFSIIK